MGVNIFLSREEAIGPTFGVGHFYWQGEGCGEFGDAVNEVSLPSGVTTFDRRPAHTEDRFKRRYVAGMYSKIVVFLEDQTLWAAGIHKPAAPGLAAVGGGTINASNNIGYVAYRQKIGSTIVHEGDISDGSATVALNGTQQRQWTLPTTAPDDPRVTHLVAYVSVDGALPKEVFEVTLGTASHTEDTATLALGDPPPVDGQGNLRNARGVPPYTRFVSKYHRRAWYFGDPLFPFRLWYSELDEFESVGPLNYLDMLENETVTGGGAGGDQFASFGQTVSYGIQGWDESDLRIFRTSPSIGCISHFAIVNINELLYLPSEIGPMVYVPGAGFRPLAHRELLTYWRDEYEAHPDAFDDCIAEDDRSSAIYKLLVIYPRVTSAADPFGDTSPASRYFIGHYQGFDPSVGDGSALPQWTFDFRAREDSAMGRLRRSGSRRSDFYTGSCDGQIRKENVESDDDDDGDAYEKLLTIDTPHYLPKAQVGDDSEGCEFTAATLYLKSEFSAWTIESRAGDDSAYLITNPNWTETVPASAETLGNRSRVPKTSHAFGRITDTAGKGVMFRVKIPKARSVEYRGLALAWVDGIQVRGLV